MKFYKYIFLIVFFSSLSVFSQEKFIRYKVSKGETIGEIAKKHKISPSAIYELNPDAVNGIKQSNILLIPTKAKNTKANTSAVVKELPLQAHVVLTKETVYGIAKQSNISVAQLYQINPELEKEGLKIGQTIQVPQAYSGNEKEITPNPKAVETPLSNALDKNIPKEKVPATPTIEEKVEIQNPEFTHEVLSKESLYSISRKYEISVTALQNANPNLENAALKAGQIIKIPSKTEGNSAKTNAIVEEKKEEKEKVLSNSTQPKQVKIPSKAEIVVDNLATENTITREVLPKESLYSIAKKYGVTVAEIQKANPELGTKSLKSGQKITIPIKQKPNSNSVEGKVVEKKKEISEIAKVVEQPKLTQEGMTGTEVTHEVLPKETKYGIAKEYGISVAELEKQNPSIANNLLVGSVLKIRSSKVIEKEVSVDVSNSDAVMVTNKNKEVNLQHDESFVEHLISKASENLGTHYRSGGTTTEGFDCSGLIWYTFANTDIKLPRSSIEMANYGSIIETENAQKGDLIFFKTRGSGRINHVGMVVEVLDGEIKFIHSASHGGVMISSTKESYYEKNLAQVNRVL